MEVFVRVIETGSFSAAARQLGVGQPAVSKTVARLEAALRGQAAAADISWADARRRPAPSTNAPSGPHEEADEADLAARGAGAGLNGRLRLVRHGR